MSTPSDNKHEAKQIKKYLINKIHKRLNYLELIISVLGNEGTEKENKNTGNGSSAIQIISRATIALSRELTAGMK